MSMRLYIDCDQYNNVELRAKLKGQLCLQAYSYLAHHHPKAPSREQLQALFDELKVDFPEVSLCTSCFPRIIEGADSGCVTAQPFNLKRGEILQIANSRPAALVEIHLVSKQPHNLIKCLMLCFEAHDWEHCTSLCPAKWQLICRCASCSDRGEL